MLYSLIPRLGKRATQSMFQRVKIPIAKSYSRTYASTSAAPPVSKNTTPKEDLTSRVLPQMSLSRGDEKSLTPLPRLIPDGVASEEKAKARFQVEGNVM
jgi:hypothetical protein